MADSDREDPMEVAAKRYKAAHELEWRLQEELIEHLNSAYPNDEGLDARTDTVFRIARDVVALHERGRLEETREETLRLAQAYLYAIQKRKDAMAAMSEQL